MYHSKSTPKTFRSSGTFLFGIAALYAFVQENWTGPALPRHLYELAYLLKETVDSERSIQTVTSFSTSDSSSSKNEADVLKILEPMEDLPFGVGDGGRSTLWHKRILECLATDGEVSLLQ